MSKNPEPAKPQRGVKEILVPLLGVPAAGALALGVCYFLYFGVFLFFEQVVFAADPNRMPVGLVRNGYAVALLAILAVLLATKLPDLVKVVYLVGAAGVAMIALILHFYMKPTIAVVSVLLFVVLAVLVLALGKRPWPYYYGLGVAVAAALFYAWPE